MAKHYSSDLVKRLVFLRALTPIHAGAGRGASEHVDLSVQRDEFGFPCIWASSFKGAVRGSLTRHEKADKQCLNIALGPPPTNASEHSSASSFLDVRLLFIPARSLKGVWTYVTSPHLVEYLATYLNALGASSKNLQEGLKKLSLPAFSRQDLLLDGSLAILNEMEVKAASVDKELPQRLFSLLPEELLATLEEHGVVVVDDDVAVDLVRRSMLIQYRVRLNEKKTVDEGPWTEEYMPQETILVSAILCKRSSAQVCNDPCQWLVEKLENLGVVWLGGKETVGKGLLKLYTRDVGGGGA